MYRFRGPSNFEPLDPNFEKSFDEEDLIGKLEGMEELAKRKMVWFEKVGETEQRVWFSQVFLL